jgi:cell division protease FtsH
VVIPQAIRDRVASNGSAPTDSESAVVLTPPGSGGDVHGDPGLHTSQD